MAVRNVRAHKQALFVVMLVNRLGLSDWPALADQSLNRVDRLCDFAGLFLPKVRMIASNSSESTILRKVPFL